MMRAGSQIVVVFLVTVSGAAVARAQLMPANTALGNVRSSAAGPSQRKPPMAPTPIPLCPAYYRDAGGTTGDVLTPSIRYYGSLVGVVQGLGMVLELCEENQAGKALGPESCTPPPPLTINQVSRDP